MTHRSRCLVTLLLILSLFALVLSPLFSQDTASAAYEQRLDQVEELILSGQRFTDPQLNELRDSCYALEEEGYAELTLRCRFLLFLAESQSTPVQPESEPLDAAILADEEKGERRSSWNAGLMIAGAGFLGAFNLFAIMSDVFYGDYLEIGSHGTVDASDLQRAAYLQAAWEAMDVAAWASLAASGMSFLLGSMAAANNPSSLGEIPPPPAKVSEDPAYERLRLQQERAELSVKIKRRSTTREALRIYGIVGIGGSIGTLGTAIVYARLRKIDISAGDYIEAVKKERTVDALGIITANLLATSVTALLLKPNVARFEDQLAELDTRLLELNAE